MTTRLALGIPLTAITLSDARANALAVIVVIWVAITLINPGVLAQASGRSLSPRQALRGRA